MPARTYCRPYEDGVIRGINPLEDVFGVRRMLDPLVVRGFRRAIKERQDQSVISHRLKMKPLPSLVLLGKTQLKSHIYKGWAHKPAETIRRRVDNNCRDFQDALDGVTVMDIKLQHEVLLNLVVESDELMEQRKSIAAALGSCGLRTLAEEIKGSPLCINLGKINRLLPLDERAEILETARAVFDEVHAFEPVQLGDTEFYPNPIQHAA